MNNNGNTNYNNASNSNGVRPDSSINQRRRRCYPFRKCEKYYCEVDVSAGPSYGAVLVDVNNVTGKEPNVYICSKLYADKYKEYIYRTLKVK